MYYGGYTLDCYCDTHNCEVVEQVNPTRVTGENASECRMKARRIGWSFVRNKCFCPKCTRAKREDKTDQEREMETKDQYCVNQCANRNGCTRDPQTPDGCTDAVHWEESDLFNIRSTPRLIKRTESEPSDG